MKRLAIVGAGSWGTALAIALAPRFERTALWVHETEVCAGLAATRENHVYLPGFKVPGTVAVSNDFDAVLDGAGIVLMVVPSAHLRGVAARAAAAAEPDALFVSAAKGLERGSLLRMSEVLEEVLGQGSGVGVLSGPSFAREVAAGDPAALVISSRDAALAGMVQRAFTGPAFRLYTNGDPTGVEIGAALKNVIAIGAGICDGLGLGSNTVAALVTRGLAEITRLAVAMGGDARTLAGLAGLGDLVLTCTGDLSRNRRVGCELGRGRKLDEILSSMRMVAEGVETTFAAHELAQRHHVEMPITEQMHAVLRDGKPPREALRDLMERAPKGE